MAFLTSQAKDEVGKLIEKRLSADRTLMPVSSQAIRTGVDTFDTELNTCEGAILAALPAGSSSWLTANPTIARRILLAVANKRKETL